MTFSSPPPNDKTEVPGGRPPVLRAVVEAYKLWHNGLSRVPRIARYSLGERITDLFIELIEALFAATFASRDQKQPLVQRAAITLDTLKLFIHLAWELRAIDNKAFANISG